MLAQLDRVPGYEPVGRGFESLTPRQQKTEAIASVFCFLNSPHKRVSLDNAGEVFSLSNLKSS